MSAGNASANDCRIERADARSASVRGDPINAVIHGYRTSRLNVWLTERLLTQASTVVSHGRPDKTA